MFNEDQSTAVNLKLGLVDPNELKDGDECLKILVMFSTVPLTSTLNSLVCSTNHFLLAGIINH